MPPCAKKEDLRKVKTAKALSASMFSLLEVRNFGKITVSDICEKALISRATFYAHFADKYDMLKCWLSKFLPRLIKPGDPYELMEKSVNGFVHKNRNIIKNLISDADDETLEILFDCMCHTLVFDANGGMGASSRHTVMSTFYAGGMVYYLLWQVKNKFPPNIMPMNEHLHEIIERFQAWRKG